LSSPSETKYSKSKTPEKSGLGFISLFKKKFGVNVGLSDHTTTDATSIAAAALGACLIEKHFTLSKDLYGPDASFSLDFDEFEKLCTSLDYVWNAVNIKNETKDINKFKQMKKTFEKSIYAKVDINVGEKITMNMLSFLKPLSKIHSSDYKKVLNKKVLSKIKAGKPLDWKHLK